MRAVGARHLVSVLCLAGLASPLAHATAGPKADRPLAELKRNCATKTSTDPKPRRRVGYVLCSGMVKSFDGTPLDVTVTLPPGAGHKRLPLVVFLHGFLNDKGEYLSQARSGTGPDRGSVAYKTVRWNNVWFASRGYAVLNYSARGQGSSGGQIGLGSKQLEVRDAQYLAGLLVDDRASRRPLTRVWRTKVAVLGSSYGGGPTWLLATTRGEGARKYGTWLSPKGRLVKLAVAVPQYTWTDLLYSLAPSGHQLSSGVDPATATTPFGIGKQTLIDGFLATAGTKFTPQIVEWLTRFNAGEPYDNPDDPIVPEAKRQLTRVRSAFYQRGYFRALRRGRVRPVPVLAGQGWTDPIFPAIEAVRMYRALRQADPSYPIWLYFGDFEHLTSQVKLPDLRRLHRLGNALIDHYLLGRPGLPRPRVRSAVTNCDPKRFGPVLKAPSWGALARGAKRFRFTSSQQTVSPLIDPRGPATDPVVVSQQRGRGCITTKLPPSPGVATYTVPVHHGFTMAGLPRLRLRFHTVAPDLELNSRLWDVAPDGTQTLVDRGAYRAVGPDPSGDLAVYELFGNAWRFHAGHRIMLEATQDDSSYLRRDNFPSTATIDSATLVLPTR